MALPPEAQEAVVTHHTDGDTLTLRAISPGTVLRTTTKTKVRLLEIDTPETVKPNTPVACYGPQASDELDDLAPIGGHVWVLNDRELKDQYGRTLLYLWDAHGQSINLALVTGGFARTDYFRPNDRYLDVLRAAEAKAQHQRVGLWGACGGFQKS